MGDLPHVAMRYPQHKKNAIGKALWRSYGIVRELEHDKVDIFHGLSVELPMCATQHHVRTVVTIHDLIFLRHPEFYHWIDAKIYAAKFYWTCKEAQRIIAISERTKRDIMYYGGVDEDKIDVIYQSCSTRFKQRETDQRLAEVKAKYQLPDRYIINVGTIEPRKNILQAVQALPLLPEDVSLVVVGRATRDTEQVKTWAERHGVSHRVKFFHGVPS